MIVEKGEENYIGHAIIYSKEEGEIYCNCTCDIRNSNDIPIVTNLNIQLNDSSNKSTFF